MDLSTTVNTSSVRSVEGDRFSIDWNNLDGSPGGAGIDSIDQTKKRRVPSGNVRSLDDEITDKKRKTATLTARSVHQNYEIAAWAIRKHLDFVSSFNFQMKTADKAFNSEVELFIQRASRPSNFDVSGRFGLAKSIRTCEALRCIDGDVGLMKITDGRVQGIEGDRIKTPNKDRDNPFDPERVFNGVEVTGTGRPRRYALHKRERGGGLEFARWVPSSSMFVHGFYDRFDQVRGVSPILAALGRFQDTYEGFDYALQRAKVAQLFGLVITREAAEANDFGQVSGEDTDGDGETDRYDVKLSGRPLIMDMEPGDGASFLENKTPAPEFQDFENMMIAVSLKSLDIPFSFYDEAYTNFFGSKAALTLYLQSARQKRADVQELLRQWTIWRLRLGISSGEISLPSFVESIEDIRFKWNPIGIPWFDPRDIRGDIDAVKAGLKTREEVRNERFGDSWIEDVAPKLEEEQNEIETRGLMLSMDTTSSAVADSMDMESESDNA